MFKYVTTTCSSLRAVSIAAGWDRNGLEKSETKWGCTAFFEIHGRS